MRRLHSIALAAWACFIGAGNAQVKTIQNEPLGTPKMVIFGVDSRPDFESWHSVLVKMGKVSTATQWKIYNTLTDDLGQTHYRAQQYYKNFPVDLATQIVHTQNGKILSVNGEIVPEKLLAGSARITEAEALRQALAFLPAETYYWQVPGQNQMLQQLTGNPDTTWFPKAQLAYIPQNFNLYGTHHLAYRFKVYAEQPLAGKTIYVDAETGAVLASQDLILHTEVNGSAATKYSGTKPMKTDSTSPVNFRLREVNRGNGIETYNMKKGTAYGSAVDFTDADNYWNNINTDKDEVAPDAHWGAEMTYDYFKNVHGRNSYDNKGAKILSFVHYSSNYNNAFWNGACMTYGDGNGTTFTPLTGLDVCGHEITHAVTTNSANLVYSYESGALNESFSDIFGNTIEIWARPSKWNWRIGEDITPSGNGIRSMTNPNTFGHPKFYKGVSWYAGAGDNGGVHTNSGVQNYWYYLIANGAKGTNEKGWTFKIDSLGIDKAGKIAYRNLTVYLTTNSQYSDARTFSIMAATDLYGACSKEVIAVTNAWWVCGVGAQYDSGYVKADFRGDTLGCFTSSTINFSNLSDNYKSCKWYFGDLSTSTNVNPSHNYSSYGKFTVKLVATSCFKNKLDSITKVNYVRIDSTPDICNAILMPKTGVDSSSSRCKGFIYDDGGESNYGALKTVYLKVTVPGADSIKFRFLVLDYEKGYDSLYLYKNSITVPNKIGGYTGNVLPFGGAWQTLPINTLWIKQFSDPLQEGKGFKIQFEGIRKPIAFNLGNDTTICMGDSLVFNQNITGGFAPNFTYTWSTGSTNRILVAKPTAKTTYHLLVKDVCTGKSKADTIVVDVRPALDVKLGKDTILCAGKSATLKAIASGGLSTAWKYTWNNGLPANASNLVTPASTTTYRVILTDGCSSTADTAYQTVIVKPLLNAVLTAGATPVCIGKSVALSVNGSGGDTAGYVFTWNNGLGTGTSKNVTLTDTGLYIVTLTDGCSVKSHSDSVWLYTHPALVLKTPVDTIICRGSSVGIDAYANGGKGSGYNYSWSSGEITSGITKSPATPTWYKVTLGDGCSPSVADSVYIDLLPALSLTKVNDTTLCDGQSLPLNLVGAGGLAKNRSISWIPATVSGYTPVLNPGTGVTNYTATLTDGCTVTPAVTSFKITKLAPLVANITVTPNAICAGDSVTLNLTVSGGKTSSRVWTLDGVPVTFLKQRLQPALAHTYNMALTDGCSLPAAAADAVTISPAAVATLSVDPLMVCENDQVLFKYSSPDAAKVMWFFSTKDSAVGTAIDYPKVFAGSGAFTAKARITTSKGCVAMFDLIDTVKAIKYPKAAFTASPMITNIENALVQTTDASAGATSWFWDFGDGFNSSIAGNQSHTYADTGWFKITLRVNVAPGCSDSTSKLIRIKDVYRMYMPSSFTPDQNGINDAYLPRGRAFKTFHMTIYNRWGMKVFESNDMSKGWDGLDKSGKPWPNGSYVVFIEIMDTEELRHVEKGTIELLR